MLRYTDLTDNMIKKTIFSFILLATFFIAPTSAFALGEFTAYPSYTHQGNKSWIIQKADPNSTIRDFITVENLSPEPINLTLSFQEAQITNNDFNTFTIPQSPTKNHLGNWIKIENPNIKLPANSSQKIPVSFLIPEDANNQTYAGVIYAAHTQIADTPGSVPITTQIGVRTYISVNSPLPAPITNDTQSHPYLLYGLVIIFMSSIIILFFQRDHKQRKFSHTAFMLIIFICGFYYSAPTQAQIMEVEITKGGYLLKGPAQINFPPIEASFEENVSEIEFRALEDNGYIEIEDLNGGTPFSVSVSATDFVSDNNLIRNHNLFIRNQDNDNTSIEVLAGSQDGVELNPTTDEFVPLSDTQTLFDRYDGDEPGKWRIFPSFELRIPENTKSGVYTNNIVFTII